MSDDRPAKTPRAAVLDPEHEEWADILRQATDVLGLGTYRILLDGTLIAMDKVLLELLDLQGQVEPEDLLGKNITELYEYMETPGRFREKVQREGKVLNLEYHYRTLSGKERWVNHNAFVVQDEATGQTAIQTIAQDITERKRLQLERQELEERMRQTQKLESLGVLAGGIAHDFNNLLTSILGYAGLCKADHEPGSRTWERLDRIEQGARTAADLTAEMLAYSGRGRFVVEPVRLSALVREMAPLLRSAATRKVDLRLELAPDLPAVQADLSQLRQVVMNLVTNAADALGDAPGTITVRTLRVATSMEDLRNPYFEVDPPTAWDHVVFEVVDSGCGMDPATEARMFEPFFSTKFTGRGLGLAAVLGIVRGHGGSVQVDTAPGKGTRVRVLFPVQEPPEQNQPSPPVAEREPASRTVLVVDDEPTVLEVSSLILEEEGYTVLTAADGERGVAVFEERRGDIALVILDLTMPRLSGAEAIQRLHAIDPEVPVLLTSGYAEDQVIDEYGVERFAGYLQKPYPPQVLVDVVRQALRKG